MCAYCHHMANYNYVKKGAICTQFEDSRALKIHMLLIPLHFFVIMLGWKRNLIRITRRYLTFIMCL